MPRRAIVRAARPRSGVAAAQLVVRSVSSLIFQSPSTLSTHTCTVCVQDWPPSGVTWHSEPSGAGWSPLFWLPNDLVSPSTSTAPPTTARPPFRLRCRSPPPPPPPLSGRRGRPPPPPRQAPEPFCFSTCLTSRPAATDQ